MNKLNFELSKQSQGRFAVIQYGKLCNFVSNKSNSGVMFASYRVGALLYYLSIVQTKVTSHIS